jgi:hypothetical protein
VSWRLAIIAAGAWLLAACADDGAAPAADGGSDAAVHDAGTPASYAAVKQIIQRSCAYVRCHDGAIIGAGLPFRRNGDYASVLVGVGACEYERMPRVMPYDPDQSWIMVKLTASFRPKDDPYANYIQFDPGPDWDPNQRGCKDQTDDGSPLFGMRMPATAPNMLPDEDLAAIRGWIIAGAPTD